MGKRGYIERVSMGKREVILREFQWVRERLY